MAKNILLKLERKIRQANSLVAVGLDPDFLALPARFKRSQFPQFSFCRWIIDQTHNEVCAYKFNLAFFEARGDRGIRELKMATDYMCQKYPDFLTIGDGKRGDVENTNKQYAFFLFDWLGFDAVTLSPYLGKEALGPFLDRKDKFSIILCRTSNSGSAELQNVPTSKGPLWKMIAKKVKDEWNKNRNCMLVMGATHLPELKAVRRMVPEMTLLVPGVGAQGGEIGKVVRAGQNKKGGGLIICSSRGIIFSTDPGQAAQRLKMEINKYRRSSSLKNFAF